MVYLPSKSSRFSSPTALIALVLFWLSPSIQMAFAAAPPIDENAYCGKGNEAHFGSKDGPAELPKACYYTGLDGTPSPGKQTRLSGKDDLAKAVDDAKCGDTLLLAAGQSYEVNTLPSKKCDDAHYITIRTDTPDSEAASGKHAYFSRVGGSRRSSWPSCVRATSRWSCETDGNTGSQDAIGCCDW